MKNQTKRIIITGNIGSGKSTLAKLFKSEGYTIIDSDKVARHIRELYQDDIADLMGITTLEPAEFTKSLGKIIFSNPIEKKKLEDFMLPMIYDKIDELILSCELIHQPFVIEAPTFFENNGLKKYEDYTIILVHADKETRIQRILKRNQDLSLEDVLLRNESQIPSEDKIPFSNLVFMNNISQELEETFKQWVNSL